MTTPNPETPETIGSDGNGSEKTATKRRPILKGLLAGGLVGTLGSLVGGDMRRGANTTPEASELHRLLREMADAGCGAVVLEAPYSSVAEVAQGHYWYVPAR